MFAENKELITLIVTILLAVIGFAAKYANDLAIARRRDRLDRINTQLRLLYGPLFALTHASGTVWARFRQQYRPDVPYFSGEQAPNEEECAAWRLWIKRAFMPLNRRMVELIIGNGDLLEGDMPRPFLDLIAHVSSYETILARWEDGDFKDHIPKVLFPVELDRVVVEEYTRLRRDQQLLIARTQRISRRRLTLV